MDIISIVNEIKSDIREKKPSDVILQKIKILCTGIPFQMVSIQNQELFRGRKNTKGLFRHISEISYPTFSPNIPEGRLNRKGESIFYGSSSELGVLIEIEPGLNNLFSIARFRLQNADKLLFYKVGLEQGLSALQSQIVTDFFYDLMSTPNQAEFCGTIAVGDFTLRTEIRPAGIFHKNPGIIYPSIKSKKISNKTTYNLAFLPETFDIFYKPVSITTCILTLNPELLSLNEINIGKFDSNGSIAWQFSFDEMMERVKVGLLYDGKVDECMKNEYKKIFPI